MIAGWRVHKIIGVLSLLAWGMSACAGGEPNPIYQVTPGGGDDMGVASDMPSGVDLGGAGEDMPSGVDLGAPDMMSEDMGGGECDQPDVPDKSGEDTNCDGIDGDAAASVFVATYGDDQNPGTKTLPMRTIGAAIATAAGDPDRSWVLVEIGNYEETINLADGVHIAGGYAFGWQRDPKGYSTIRHNGTGATIEGADITSATMLLNLEVRPSMTVVEGTTALTMVLERSPGVVLQRVRVVGGAGGSGVDGAKGQTGATGNRGGNGNDGKEDGGTLVCSKNSQPARGTAGEAKSCPGGIFSGAGGRGGLPGKSKDNGGAAGEAGPGGGGTAGTAGAAKGAGGAGGEGPVGAVGAPGMGGVALGGFEGRRWVGRSGAFGEAGAPGLGGGGGGGGGGAGGSTFDCSSWGGSGGGGGSGGCGGSPGAPGGPGGASVALLLLDSDILIDECKFTLGQGGQGGNGGAGGDGGNGGPAGNASVGEDGSGGGGVGGVGGKGGAGGFGGGGAGGPVFGIYTNVALSQPPIDAEFTPGSPGRGGNGFGAEGMGAAGVEVEVQVGPLE